MKRCVLLPWGGGPQLGRLLLVSCRSLDPGSALLGLFRSGQWTTRPGFDWGAVGRRSMHGCAGRLVEIMECLNFAAIQRHALSGSLVAGRHNQEVLEGMNLGIIAIRRLANHAAPRTLRMSRGRSHRVGTGRQSRLLSCMVWPWGRKPSDGRDGGRLARPTGSGSLPHGRYARGGVLQPMPCAVPVRRCNRQAAPHGGFPCGQPIGGPAGVGIPATP